jgi:hypothetical protein
MKTLLALQIAILLSVSITSIAATVDYEHPDLTIVAKDEPLDSVLKSLGKEMRIYIVVPAGFNPVVSCDIQQRPIKQAFKTLLGGMSYSLEWEENTGQLAGLTILAGGGNTAVATVTNNPSHGQSVSQATPAAVVSTGGQSATPASADQGGRDTAMADHEARIEAQRAVHEARMATDRAEHEARMVEERAAQEERMKEDVARHEAEMAAYLESQGLPPTP